MLARESWGCLTRPCCTRRLTQVEKGHWVLEKGVKNIASRLSRREEASIQCGEHICERLAGQKNCRITREANKVSSHLWNFPVFLSLLV